MQIVWDETKRRANLVKHGLDFAVVDLDFFAQAIFRQAHSDRRQALGWLTGERLLVSVVFRPLGSESVALISLRPASSSERVAYGQGF